jgi:hypothetical protein
MFRQNFVFRKIFKNKYSFLVKNVLRNYPLHNVLLNLADLFDRKTIFHENIINYFDKIFRRKIPPPQNKDQTRNAWPTDIFNPGKGLIFSK